MQTDKAFAVVESLDHPKDAMLVRYQIVERVEPDQEEARILNTEVGGILSDLPGDTREALNAQVDAFKALSAKAKVQYRIDTKMVLCASPEEVTRAIQEAKEADTEIARLKKSGAQFTYGPMNRLI